MPYAWLPSIPDLPSLVYSTLHIRNEWVGLGLRQIQYFCWSILLIKLNDTQCTCNAITVCLSLSMVLLPFLIKLFTPLWVWMVVVSLPFLVLQPTITRLEPLNSTTLELEWKVGLCNMLTSNTIVWRNSLSIIRWLEYYTTEMSHNFLPCLAEKHIQLRCTWTEGVCVCTNSFIVVLSSYLMWIFIKLHHSEVMASLMLLTATAIAESLPLFFGRQGLLSCLKGNDGKLIKCYLEYESMEGSNLRWHGLDS